MIIDFKLIFPQGKTIVRPENIPIDVFLEELRHYQLDEDTLEDYLWEGGLLKQQSADLLHGRPSKTENPFRLFIWNILHRTDDQHIFTTDVFNFITFGLIFMSLFIFCSETLVHPRQVDTKKPHSYNETEENKTFHYQWDENSRANYKVLVKLEWICDIWFLGEFLLHWFSAKDRYRHVSREDELFL